MARTLGEVNIRGTAAAFAKEIWSTETVDAIEFEQVLAATVDTRFESQMRSGRVLHIPHVSNLDVVDKVAGTDVTFETVTQTNQDITVDTWKYAAFEVNDITKVQANVDLRKKYTGKVGYALARAIEVSLAALPIGFTSNTALGTLLLELGEDDYLQAWTYLQTWGAPMSDRFLWLSSGAAAAAMKIDKFVSKEFVSGPATKAVEKATLGDLYGFTVVESQLLAGSVAAGHQCAAFQRQQMYLIRQEKPAIEADRIIESLTDAVVGHCLYTVAEAELVSEAVVTGDTEVLGDFWGVYLKTV